jgi:hypothetical protein
MKKNKKINSPSRSISCSQQEGSVLVIVVCVCFILMMAGMALAIMSAQSTHTSRRLAVQAQSLALAERGVADMVARLSTNYYYWMSNNFTETVQDGSYTVRCAVMTNNNVIITSDAVYRGISNTTVMELLGTSMQQNNRLLGLGGAVLSDGIINFRTAAFAMHGNIHGNNNITSASGAQNGTINGSVSAVGVIGNLDASDGLISSAPYRDIPQFNFDSYRALAIAANRYYTNGDQTFSGTIDTGTNFVIYVNGNVTISQQSSMCGTLVANGNITINNHFTQTQAYSNRPALLATGSIDIQNHQSYEGCIYAGFNVSIQNNVTLSNCTVIAQGIVSIENNVTIYGATVYPAWDPFNPEVPPEVIAGGWLK